MYCLRVFVCDIKGCHGDGFPPTARREIEKLLAGSAFHHSLTDDCSIIQSNLKCKGAAGLFPGKVTFQTCNETACYFFLKKMTGWELMQNQGHHNYPWPQAKKPHKLAQKELKAQIAMSPKASALKLKVSSSVTLSLLSFYPSKVFSWVKFGQVSTNVICI